MRSVGILLASVFALAAPAQAGVLLTDNFDSENGGVYALNYNGFTNWNVTKGNVDIVFTGDVFGLNCNSGGCVDLDGTPGPGEITSKTAFAYAANEILRVNFDLSGSHRDVIGDDFYVNFVGGESNFVGYGYSDGSGDHITWGAYDASAFASMVAPFAPWELHSVFVITGAAGSSNVAFGTNSADQKGPLLDNVVVSTGAVPEPATWAMMIAGFGLVGSALRRRKTAVAFA